MTKNQYKVNTNLDEEVVEKYGENIRGYKQVKQTKTDSIKNKFYDVEHLRNKPNSKKTPKQVKVSKLKKARVAVRLAEINEISKEENEIYKKYGENKYNKIKNYKPQTTSSSPKKVLSSRVKHETNHKHSHINTALDLSVLVK